MKFRLTYEGEIRNRPAAGLRDIHRIRQSLHSQLKRLWEHPPFADLKYRWLRKTNPIDPEAAYARIKQVDRKGYAPLIAEDLGAELDIVLLRQQSKGGVIGQGGEIDSQLKTLFEALRIPTKAEVQQLDDAALDDEDPLHCLLLDHALIHRVSFETDRLLKDVDDRRLMAIIQVSIVVTKVTWDTVILTGE